MLTSLSLPLSLSLSLVFFFFCCCCFCFVLGHRDIVRLPWVKTQATVNGNTKTTWVHTPPPGPGAPGPTIMLNTDMSTAFADPPALPVGPTTVCGGGGPPCAASAPGVRTIFNLFSGNNTAFLSVFADAFVSMCSVGYTDLQTELSDEVTDAPTDAVTDAPTDAPTDAFTDAPTEMETPSSTTTTETSTTTTQPTTTTTTTITQPTTTTNTVCLAPKDCSEIDAKNNCRCKKCANEKYLNNGLCVDAAECPAGTFAVSTLPFHHVFF